MLGPFRRCVGDGRLYTCSMCIRAAPWWIWLHGMHARHICVDEEMRSRIRMEGTLVDIGKARTAAALDRCRHARVVKCTTTPVLGCAYVRAPREGA